MSEESLSLERILASRRAEAGEVVNVDEPRLKLVIITLAGDWFAVVGDKVREILPDTPVFILPGCPPTLEGVINVRGEIEPVINLCGVLGYDRTAAPEGSRILLCRSEAMQSGLRVDAVEEVLDVPCSAIQPPPHTVAEERKALVAGIVALGDRMVTLLDLDRLLANYRAGLG
jgi:purine-binding chemotaxis protein CheW